MLKPIFLQVHKLHDEMQMMQCAFGQGKYFHMYASLQNWNIKTKQRSGNFIHTARCRVEI